MKDKHAAMLYGGFSSGRPVSRASARAFAGALEGEGHRMPVAPAPIMDRRDIVREHPVEPPCVVKPVAEGSSPGVVVMLEDEPHPPQMTASPEWRHSDTVMVEREPTCAIMGDFSPGVAGAEPLGHKFRDYESKYAGGGSKRECPAKFSPNIYQKIETLALKAHQAIGCRGITRSDFRFDDSVSPEGELVWLEVDTQPGMTPTSLVPEQALHSGRAFGESVRWMVEDASCSR